jgi:hypothetical protein
MLLPLGPVVVVLLLHCGPGGEVLPPLQTVVLDATGDLRRFEGRWFDPMDGYLTAVVAGGDRPRFSIRLGEELVLESARIEDGSLHFRFRTAEGPRTLRMQPVAENEVLVGPPSEGWCCTCVWLERNRSPWTVARMRASLVAESCLLAYDSTWDWLVDVL